MQLTRKFPTSNHQGSTSQWALTAHALCARACLGLLDHKTRRQSRSLLSMSLIYNRTCKFERNVLKGREERLMPDTWAKSLSCVHLFGTPWTVARQAPLSMGFSRQEYWRGLPCPPPGDLCNPGIEPMSLMSPALQAGSLTLEPPGKPQFLSHPRHIDQS